MGPVILSALIHIAKSFVCFAELIAILLTIDCPEAPGSHYTYQLELGRCVAVLVPIRMLLQSQLPVCFRDSSEICPRRDLEDGIVVATSCSA
jgi:hypothetical protein